MQRDILEEVEGEGDGEVEGEGDGEVEGEGDGELGEEAEVNEKQFEEAVEDKEEDESLVLTDFINNDPIVEQFQVYFILFLITIKKNSQVQILFFDFSVFFTGLENTEEG